MSSVCLCTHSLSTSKWHSGVNNAHCWNITEVQKCTWIFCRSIPNARHTGDRLRAYLYEIRIPKGIHNRCGFRALVDCTIWINIKTVECVWGRTSWPLQAVFNCEDFNHLLKGPLNSNSFFLITRKKEPEICDDKSLKWVNKDFILDFRWNLHCWARPLKRSDRPNCNLLKSNCFRVSSTNSINWNA